MTPADRSALARLMAEAWGVDVDVLAGVLDDVYRHAVDDAVRACEAQRLTMMKQSSERAEGARRCAVAVRALGDG